jgi:hypothetical protein
VDSYTAGRHFKKEMGKRLIKKKTSMHNNIYKPMIFIFCVLLFGSDIASAKDSAIVSTKKEAITYLSTITGLSPSKHWPNVNPDRFLENIRLNVNNPLSLYAGRGTNFCSYAALSYIPLNNDPLGFVKFMLALYNNGTASMGNVTFSPSVAILKAAGTLRFKGKMDTRHADQVWLLLLADHFKGYLNILNRNYDAGDEDRFWAASNLAKFNRMIRRLFNYDIKASGSDIIRPGKKNIVEYLLKHIDSGIVFLYVNNTLLAKKDHGAKKRLPSHFIVLNSIAVKDDKVTITYSDNGSRTLRQMSRKFLKKIVFGISVCKPKANHAG